MTVQSTGYVLSGPGGNPCPGGWVLASSSDSLSPSQTPVHVLSMGQAVGLCGELGVPPRAAQQQQCKSVSPTFLGGLLGHSIQ